MLVKLIYENFSVVKRGVLKKQDLALHLQAMRGVLLISFENLAPPE